MENDAPAWEEIFRDICRNVFFVLYGNGKRRTWKEGIVRYIFLLNWNGKTAHLDGSEYSETFVGMKRVLVLRL
jgi:hypothetical protein